MDLLKQVETLSALAVQQPSATEFAPTVLDWLKDSLHCQMAELIWAGQRGALLDWKSGIAAKTALTKQASEEIAGDMAIVAIPIQSRSALLGVLAAGRPAKEPFTEQEKQAMRIAASHLSVANRAQNHHPASFPWQGEMATIYEALAALSSAELSLNHVGQVALSRFIDALAVEGAVLVLWEPQMEQLLPRLYVDNQGNVQLMPLDAGIIYSETFLNNALAQRQTIQITEEEAESDPEIKMLFNSTGGSNLLLTPIYGRRAARGVIILISNDPGRQFTLEELHFTDTFGKHAALAIEQGALFDQAKRSVEEMAVLQATALDISSHITLPRLLKRLSERASMLINAEYTAIFLYNIPDDMLQLATTYLASDDSNDQWNALGIGEPVAQHIIETGQSELLENYWEWSGQPIPNKGNWHSFRTVAAVPLKAEGELVGALVAIDNAPARLFRQRDLYLLDMLAPQAATSIRNVQLFDELELRMLELKRKENQLQQSEKLASIGRMAAAIAHEVNNPLQSVRNCLNISKRKNVPAEKRGHYLDMALNEVERLSNTVQQLLEFYRPSEGERSEVDVVQLIERVLALLERQLVERNVKVIREDERPLPAWGVSDHLHQVLLNLILNSMDAMPMGGELRIKSKSTEENEVAIFVQDTGSGIEPERLPEIFEPFVTSKTQGTGLGLATSLAIVEAHGGQMRVTSTPGEGTSFVVVLPTIKKLKEGWL